MLGYNHASLLPSSLPLPPSSSFPPFSSLSVFRELAAGSPGQPQTFCSPFCFSFPGAERDWDSAPQPGHPGWAWWGVLGHSHDYGEERLIRPFKGNKGACGCWRLVAIPWPVVSGYGHFLAHLSCIYCLFCFPLVVICPTGTELGASPGWAFSQKFPVFFSYPLRPV